MEIDEEADDHESDIRQGQTRLKGGRRGCRRVDGGYNVRSSVESEDKEPNSADQARNAQNTKEILTGKRNPGRRQV
jgi:hypothetical protein